MKNVLLMVLYGRPITKKNHMVKTQTGLIQSPQYRLYEHDCIYQIPVKLRLRINKRVNVCCLYYMPTKGNVDLLNLESSTCDILVKAGVLEDDNSKIVAGHDGSRVFYDKNDPRVEIMISLMEE